MKKDINKFINIGDTVEIPVYIDEEKIILKSSIEGIGDNNRIVISAPLYKLNYYSIRQGDILKLHIKSKSGIVEFKAKLLRRVKIRKLLTLVLDVISDPLLIQRREFFRLNILKDIRVSHNERTFNLTTKEMSAGGLSGVVVDIGDINVGEKLEFQCNIGSESLNLLGELLYCEPIKDSIRRYEYRIKFLNVSPSNRKKLLNYIFSEQRKLMKKK